MSCNFIGVLNGIIFSKMIFSKIYLQSLSINKETFYHLFKKYIKVIYQLYYIMLVIIKDKIIILDFDIIR